MKGGNQITRFDWSIISYWRDKELFYEVLYFSQPRVRSWSDLNFDSFIFTCHKCISFHFVKIDKNWLSTERKTPTDPWLSVIEYWLRKQELIKVSLWVWVTSWCLKSLWHQFVKWTTLRLKYFLKWEWVNPSDLWEVQCEEMVRSGTFISGGSLQLMTRYDHIGLPFNRILW